MHYITCDDCGEEFVVESVDEALAGHDADDCPAHAGE